MVERVRVAIVGAGTAGLSALREVRRHTEDLLLINSGDWGTTCAARGCMPSKTLIEAANAFHRRHDFAEYGLTGSDSVGVNVAAVLERVRRLRDDFVRGPETVSKSLGDRAVSARARLLGPGRLRADGREIHADKIILAPGSRPYIPEDWRKFGARVLTTDTLFEQPDLPARIAVVGLGALGVEMAQALSRLGIQIAGFHSSTTLAGLTDVDVSAALQSALEREFPLYLGSLAQLSQAHDGVAVSNDAGSFNADAVLLAIGRRPNIDTLDLDTLGVMLDERGMPEVDRNTLRIGELDVWLVGDANGQRALLHEAADEGHIAGRNAVADSPHGYRRRTAMSVVFSAPNVAQVGARLGDLDAESLLIGTSDFSRQGRARIAQQAHGLLHIYADAKSGKLLGAEMCVPAAEHMVHLLALAIQNELDVWQVLAMPFYHPVLEEGLRTALREIARQLPEGDRSDLSECTNLGIAALD